MSQYDILITAWTAGTVPVGATGSAFVGGDTTVQKLVKVNAWIITGVVPAVFTITADQILNALNWGEFNTLPAAAQNQLLQVCTTPGTIVGGASSFIGGMVVNFYSNKLGGPTISNFTALAKATVTPWWQAQPAQGGLGFSQPVTLLDAAAAGLS